MHRMLNEERLGDDVDGVIATFVDDDADEAWDDDDASFDDEDFDDEGFDALPSGDWPRGAVDACAPEGAFYA